MQGNPIAARLATWFCGGASRSAKLRDRWKCRAMPGIAARHPPRRTAPLRRLRRPELPCSAGGGRKSRRSVRL